MKYMYIVECYELAQDGSYRSVFHDQYFNCIDDCKLFGKQCCMERATYDNWRKDHIQFSIKKCEAKDGKPNYDTIETIFISEDFQK